MTCHILEIKMDARLVGQLVFDQASDAFQLNYDKAWCKHGFALSPHLPLQGEIDSISIKRFLENLFPEGNALESLVEQYRISKSNTFGIITLLGEETTGAFTFNLENSQLIETSFRELSLQELTDRLNHRSRDGLIIWDGKPRLSVAGVHDKLPITILNDGRMGFGEGEIASTHILKFQTERESLPCLVINEFFCLRLAKKVGLNVAYAEYRQLGNHPVLVVKRFDRELNEDKTVTRKHIIDGCQSLNLPSAYKYEQQYGSGRDVAHIRDGASLSKLFKFCKDSIAPAADFVKLLDWTIFNLCISNMDAHGKNLSFFVTARGIRLAPFYDLVNIAVYPTLDQKMAMAMGDEFTLDSICAYQLADFAEECGIDRPLLIKRLKFVCNNVQESLNELDLGLNNLSIKEKKFVGRLQEMIALCCGNLLNMADEIVSVEL